MLLGLPIVAKNVRLGQNYALYCSVPSQKIKPRFNREKARFNRDEYNFNGINRDLSEILSYQDFIIINLEDLSLTRLTSVSLNEN